MRAGQVPREARKQVVVFKQEIKNFKYALRETVGDSFCKYAITSLKVVRVADPKILQLSQLIFVKSYSGD